MKGDYMANIKEEVSTTKAKKEEMVKIMLPISKEHQEDVQVCINGKWTVIQRGVEVEVTPEVYEVLQNKARMEKLALDRLTELKLASKKALEK